jgi:hypothetical protein
MGVTSLIFDKKLTFRMHIEYILEKCSKLIKIYYHLSVKLTLYKTVFRAAMLYASPAWTGCAESHNRRLQVMQNKILKMILRKPWWYGTDELHDEAEMVTVVDHTGLTDQKFVGALRFSQNPLIQTLANT